MTQRTCEGDGGSGMLDRITVHRQRHTHISQLLLAGVPVKAVSDRVGHANVSVTLDTSSHRTREARPEAADVAEKLLLG
jgi:integrase